MKLKPISEQVVVITGASSGIGRETALRFAERGAKVVGSARDEAGLQSLVEEITAQGGQAIYYVCDVSSFIEVSALANKAVSQFGRIDTWVNNAAVGLYATFEETTLEEFRQIFDVNLLGQIHGAKAALPHLLENGGALICVSSVEARVSMPLHSAYAASKHGVEGFLDSLRRELLHEGTPVSITNIMPASINTPFFSNARTKMGVKPQGAPPFYQPEIVANTILYAAENPVRELIAGGSGKMMILGQKFAPVLMDMALARYGFDAQQTDELKSEAAPNNLFHPVEGDDRAEGDFSSRAKETSLYTWIETRPIVSALLTAGTLGAAAILLMRSTIRRKKNIEADTSHINPAEAEKRNASLKPVVLVASSGNS
jgi:NAD(P)-dependent dehydrogenase (short-subunit alcohol dehydrogenase family)